MSDLLKHIAAQSGDIVRQWARDIRDLPNAGAAGADEDALLASAQRSHQALLAVMQTGDTGAMESLLRASVRQRIADGIGYGDTLAVWLLYRQAVQKSLTEALQDADIWEQLIDRVDAVLNWVVAVLQDAYGEANGGAR